MPRFFCEKSALDYAFEGDRVFLLDGENGHHLAKALRVRTGEKVTLSDGEGNDYFCTVKEVNGETVSAYIDEKKLCDTEPSVKVCLYQCLMKSDKFDFTVQKACELGVTEIYPVISEFCVAKIDGKQDKKIQRWQKIALEAAKQSGRGIIPKITEPVSFKEAVKTAVGTKIMCYEHGGVPFRNLVAENISDVSVFIGSEGGFSEKEVETAKENGVNIATLGKRILRAETAPITAISVIMALTGNLE